MQAALFYPHMSFRSRRWLRTAVLYYDKIARIVPTGFDPDILENPGFLADEDRDLFADVKALRDAGVIEEERPERHTSEVADQFFDFAWKHLSHPESLADIAPKLAARKEFYTINPAKMDPALARVLQDQDLVRRVAEDDSDWAINPLIGGLYMLFLARHIAGQKPLISDNSIYQRLLCTSLGEAEDKMALTASRPNNALKLVTAACKAVVPTGLDVGSIKSLLNVRDKFAEHRDRFQTKITELAQTLDSSPDQKDVPVKIVRQMEMITDEIENIKDKLLSQNISVAAATAALTIPVIASAVHGNFSTSIATGAIAIGTCITKYVIDRRVIERSPWMYLFNVSKAFQPKDFADRLTRLDMNFVNDGEDDDKDTRTRFRVIDV
jgi:hypothetical protein